MASPEQVTISEIKGLSLETESATPEMYLCENSTLCQTSAHLALMIITWSVQGFRKSS